MHLPEPRSLLSPDRGRAVHGAEPGGAVIRQCADPDCRRLVRWTSHCEEHRPAATSPPTDPVPVAQQDPAVRGRRGAQDVVPHDAEHVVRRTLRIPRPEGFPEFLVDVDVDGQAVCPTCDRLLPTAEVLSHHGLPVAGGMLPMRDDADDPPPARRPPWDLQW